MKPKLVYFSNYPSWQFLKLYFKKAYGIFSKVLFSIYLLVFVGSTHVLAQNFGLGFNSHEVKVENRTGLNLTTLEKFELKSNFSLTFDMKLIPGNTSYFGYIFRFFINDKQNIDLIHELKKDRTISKFTIIYGTENTKLTISIPSQKLKDQWNTIKLVINPEKETLTFSVDDSVKTQQLVKNQSGLLDLYFGVNKHVKHPTTDVPNFALKDVQIWSENELKYHWPLNNIQGDKITDIIKGLEADVYNPIWLNALHTNWQKVMSTSVKGFGKLVSDVQGNTIYLIGKDSIKSYSVQNNDLILQNYKQEDLFLLRGEQAVWDPFSNQILIYSIDRQEAFRYDNKTQKWDNNFNGKLPLTVYSQHNKTISKTDSSLYCFGGYGQYKYKNDIYRLDLKNLKWEKIIPQGDFLKPRYLASLGTNSTSDTAYIIGGFGSKSGEQMMNPDYYHDLMSYSFKDRKLKKIYELSEVDSGFCFANSLVINDKERKFYGLIYPKNKYENTLQLFTGSLDRAEYSITPTGIPYLFDDIKSYADLVFLPQLGKLVALTSHQDRDSISIINVYSISFPPIVMSNKSLSTKEIQSNKWLIWVSIIFLILISGFLLWYIKFRKKVNKIAPIIDNEIVVDAPLPVIETIKEVTEIQPKIEKEPEPIPKVEVKIPQEINIVNPPLKPKEVIVNSVFLFGKFRLYNRLGVEISGSFSPLLKELFLLILLNSFEKKGIGSQQIDEILWFDKSIKSAQNNRAVNIAKLRNIFNDLDGIELMHERNHWSFDFNHNIFYCDYSAIKSVINGSSNNSTIISLEKMDAIASRGPLFLGLSYEWLDDFKSNSSDLVIEGFLDLMLQIDLSENSTMIIKAANTLFTFDPVNEEAMRLKCKAYISLGNHTQANDAYIRFVKDYKTLYGESYKISFNKTIKD